jgi:iron complex transport system permease protein
MTVISPFELFTSGSPDAEVFWRLRLPRTIAAYLAGAGLSVSGLVFQAMFRNPLATPFMLGVSSGAAFGASVYFRLGIAFSVLGSMGSLGAALLGGLLSMFFVYMITRAKGGFSTPVMLLAGVVINFFFSSLMLFIQYWSNSNDSLKIMHWLMGSLTGLEIARLADLAFIVIAGSAIIFRLAFELDLFTAGEELAASRGVPVRRTKITAFAVSSVMVGAVVSLAGPIGFVGMMVPHICRLKFGWSHARLLPASFMLGGCFLVLCDLLSRSVLAPAEIPIGIITALIGGPFFLWTLFRTNRSGDLVYVHL